MDVEKRYESALGKMQEVIDSVSFLTHAVEEFSGNVREGRSIVSGTEVTSSTSLVTRTTDELFEYLDDVLSSTYLELVFQAQFNIFEAALFDMLSIYLKSNLTLLSQERNLSTGAVLSAGSYENLITEIIHNELNKVAYGSIHKWIKQINKYLSYKVISDSDLLLLAEMKATRNLLVHTDGVCNKIYLEASGEQARFEIGDRVTIDYTYLYHAHLLLSCVLDKALKAILSKN
ncbi:hypothetical protein [Shewanella atlantica]|uniref:MAE-28990/MAE-18760-like HEPN domain-containing protein n=1 Tax=Shewanella atlantica TaxID=271099 RepID=A0A431WE94_9GAMM|nr:hypothetical protein [Shewanella atlantica]RTR33631.1 hypothetical protein EKG39_07935 [Shewanella atlantica]